MLEHQEILKSSRVFRNGVVVVDAPYEHSMEIDLDLYSWDRPSSWAPLQLRWQLRWHKVDVQDNRGRVFAFHTLVCIEAVTCLIRIAVEAFAICSLAKIAQYPNSPAGGCVEYFETDVSKRLDVSCCHMSSRVHGRRLKQPMRVFPQQSCCVRGCESQAIPVLIVISCTTCRRKSLLPVQHKTFHVAADLHPQFQPPIILQQSSNFLQTLDA